MKTKLFFTTIVLFYLNTNAQTFNPTFYIDAANTANTFKGGYTFAYASSGTPWSGSLISFGGFANNYDTQISASYYSNNISYRSKSSDMGGGWTPWVELASKNSNIFAGNQTINGNIVSSVGSNEGGSFTLKNPLKTATNAASSWAMYNMTGAYGNSLQFWRYLNNGGGGPALTLDDNGNVGIGTNNPENNEGWNRVLQIKGNTDSKILSSSNNITSGLFTHDYGFYGSPAGGIVGTTTNHPFSVITNKVNRLVVANNGNIGIGTTTPIAKLHVNNGDYSYGTILANANESSFSLYTKTLTTQTVDCESFRMGLKYNNEENNGFISFYRGSSASGGFLGFSSNGLERMRLDRAGNVGIGSSNPDEKLIVKGKIHAEEVKIDLAVPADYVFQKYYTGKSSLKANYTMPTLEEVEEFTKANNHLPSIPSAAEIKNNGVQLGEMSNLLLQKIEELTLYIIDLKKEMNTMKTEIKILKNGK